ncbi:uncharacterized protein PAC_16620 [Phialocephala subalpina]|uniref:BTB domain-containing protein n=1 Tax=Phialocephala subalpina TaxID=576137 RepID=A0A1L7XNW5_9HELO|nr:uncharacterized protein PAC_16620 [Phialocephala subalpina]
MPSTDHHQLEQLASTIASLRSGKYSDFTIRCSDGALIRVHRAIVCPRSQVLSAAVDGAFKEALSQEIFLEEDEPLIVAKMIDFLYCLDYDDHRLDAGFQGTESIPAVDETAAAEPPTGLNASSLLVNAKTYIIADKYNIQSLKEWAVTKYKEVVPATWNSASFVESARLIFENTPESDRMLREIIIRKASENVKALFDRSEFVTLLQGHGDFTMEVLRDVVFNPPDDVRLQEVELDFSWGCVTTKKDKRKSRF